MKREKLIEEMRCKERMIMIQREREIANIKMMPATKSYCPAQNTDETDMQTDR